MVRSISSLLPMDSYLFSSFFFFLSSQSLSFVFPQTHLCFKPDLDVQNFTSPLGNQSESQMPGPCRNGVHTHPDKKVGSWRVLSLGLLLAFMIMTRPGGSNKAARQSRQQLLSHLTPTLRGPRTAPCFRPPACLSTALGEQERNDKEIANRRRTRKNK